MRYTFVRYNIKYKINQTKVTIRSEKGKNQKLKLEEMKNKFTLFLLLIVLSLAIFSCYPLNQNRYGDQNNREQGNRGQVDRHHRHQQDSHDQEDNYYHSHQE